MQDFARSLGEGLCQIFSKYFMAGLRCYNQGAVTSVGYALILLICLLVVIILFLKRR